MNRKIPKQLEIQRTKRRSLKKPVTWLALATTLAITALAGNLPLLWRCEHWWALLLAWPAGHLLFGMSAALNSLTLSRGIEAFVQSVRHIYRPFALETMAFYLVIAVAEELLFRALPLTLLGGELWVVVVFAAGFALAHFPKRKGTSLFIMLVDFFAFGLISGFLFVWLGDLWPIVIVHWVRNVSVAKEKPSSPGVQPDNKVPDTS